MKSLLRVAVFIFIFSSGISANSIESTSADKFFNLGNAAYNDGDFGDAVYNYEKALILNPRASDIKVNLQLAVERLDADIIELDPFFLADWWKGLSNLLLPGGWKLVSLFFLFSFLGLVFILFFKDTKRSKSIYTFGTLFLFLVFISSLAGYTRSNSIYNNRYAVISEGAETIFLGPDKVSEKIKPVVGGVKVKILDSNTGWYKVATLDSEQGWIQKENVRLLKFLK